MPEEMTKTSLEGRVTYDNIEYSWLSSEDMRIAGEKMAAAFPEWQVVVTGGPYRGYDVACRMNREEKIIVLDFYSARPGLGRMDEVIEEMKGRLLLDDHGSTWTP